MVRDRRDDLSPYLVHLTRDDVGPGARENLLNLLANPLEELEARNPYGLGIAHFRHEDSPYGDDFISQVEKSQRVVCFTETPLDELATHLKPARWGDFQFRPYGFAFEREYLLKNGANPVWYLNTYAWPGVTFRWLSRSVYSEIDDQALDDSGEPDPKSFLDSEIRWLVPFMEIMGEWGERRYDFSFEREWRILGHFDFSWTKVKAIILPEGESQSFRDELRERAPYGDAWYEQIAWRELSEEDIAWSAVV